MAVLLVPRLVFIALTVTSSLSFVLRRRDWDDDADTGLAQALPVLREERRRLEERPLVGNGESFWDEPDLRDDEGLDEPLNLSPRLRQQEEEEEEAKEDLLRPLLENVDPNYMQEVLGDDLLQGDEDPEDDVIEKPANIDELEDILKPSEEEKENSLKEKRNIPIALGGPGPDRHSNKRDKANNDLNRLLQAKAEEIEQEALAKSDQDELDTEITPLPVSKADIEQMLKDDEEEKEREAEEANETEAEKEDTQKEIMPSLNYGPLVPLKIKRSSSRRQDVLAENMEEGQLAREYIRRFLELEDDENTNLANALNLATMAQVKHSDKLIIPEAKFIKKAIEDEEAIQELKASLSGGIQGPAMAAGAIGKRELEFSPEELVEEAEEEEEEKEEEEGEPIGPPPGGFFTEEVVEEEEEPDESDLAERLRNYLVQAGSHLGMDVEENEIPDDSETNGEWFDQRSNAIEDDDDMEAEEDWELNPLLRELYRRYQSGIYNKRGEPDFENMIPQEEEDIDDEFDVEEEEEPSEDRIDVLEEEVEDALENYIRRRQEEEAEEEAEEEEAEEEGGICPALELVDGCSYAVRNLGLKLDAEALDLCNRHQLCYACGAAHGMSSSDCDNGYLMEANRLCEAQGDDGDCSTDAAGLFVVMLESHKFRLRDTPDVCSDRCTMDYVVGMDEK